MILSHDPGWIVFLASTLVASVAGGAILCHFYLGLYSFAGDDTLDLSQSFGLGFPHRKATVNVENASIGYGVAAGSRALDLGNGEASLSQKSVVSQARSQEFHAEDQASSGVNSVLTAFWGRSVTGATSCRHL